jgi:hypothetical protein
MEHRWNEIDREQKYSEKNLSQCHFVHHKSTWTGPRSNPDLRDERPATNRLSHGTANPVTLRNKIVYFECSFIRAYLTNEEKCTRYKYYRRQNLYSAVKLLTTIVTLSDGVKTRTAGDRL